MTTRTAAARPPSRRTALKIMGGVAVAGLAAPAASGAANAAVAGPTRGFNLPRWVDREDGVAPSGPVLEKLGRLGFETVRLPVNADLIAAPDRTTRTRILQRIDAALSTLLGAGFAVIVDLHPSGQFLGLLRRDPSQAGQMAGTAWTLLADVVAAHPADRVYAELLNEPPLSREDWLTMRERLPATVRARCPRHGLVWGPARYQGIWEFAGTPPLSDANQIAAVHYYTPMGFTHQCENWDTSPLARLRNLPFPATRDTPAVAALAETFRVGGDRQALNFLEGEFKGPWTVARIKADFADAAAWSRDHGCRIILDEFGVLNFCVDPASRANWIGAVRRAAEKNGIGWTYWEVDQGFGFIRDRGSADGFDRSVIDALVSG